MKIVIDPFDKKSIDAAVKMVQQYEKDFEAKEQEFVRRLAEIGVSVAQVGYSTAVDYAESSGIKVYLEKTPSGYSVKADGEKVGFLEFGTGIRNREWDNTGMEYTPPKHGTYGKLRGAQEWGWWYYPQDRAEAVHTYGEMPVEAMRLARDEMIERVTQIAREVWK